MMGISFVKSRLFSAAPEGTAALFFIQIFATLGFAVLYSTLVLYATKHLHLGVKEATTLMGVFGAFNYGLHLFGGYLGGRFLSNRNLFVGGMALQVIGCACIATGTLALFYVGLALFLTGSGLNVTCINMMLTQRFTPEDPRREGAFLWNYAGMNVGFFVGFSVAGMTLYPLAKAAEVMRFYRDFTRGCSDELSAVFGILTGPDGQALCAIAVCCSGTLAKGENLVEPLRKFGPPMVDLIGPKRYDSEVQRMFDAAFPS